jgi:hypothetical protein
MGIAYGVTTNFQATKGIVQDGLVYGLVLNLDAGVKETIDGTTLYDLSDNKYNATIANGPVYNKEKCGKIICDGTNDFLYIDNTLNMSYVTVSTVWTKDSSAGGSESIVFNKENAWEIHDGNNNLSWAIKASNKSWFWRDTGYNVVIGQPLQVDLTYDGNYVKTYINGSLYETYTYPANGTLFQSTSYPKLNSRNSTKTTWAGGGTHTYYRFSVYNRALTAAEVSRNFNVMRHRFGI